MASRKCVDAELLEDIVSGFDGEEDQRWCRLEGRTYFWLQHDWLRETVACDGLEVEEEAVAGRVSHLHSGPAAGARGAGVVRAAGRAGGAGVVVFGASDMDGFGLSQRLKASAFVNRPCVFRAGRVEI